VGTTSRPPKWIKPQLTRLADEAPAGDGWLHEIKYDGYRMHARISTIVPFGSPSRCSAMLEGAGEGASRRYEDIAVPHSFAFEGHCIDLDIAYS
jgi:hypothetical protein